MEQKEVQLEGKRKAFETIHRNQVILTFPNGNSVSTVWGAGTYTDNHFNFSMDSFNKAMESNTVEFMFLSCDKKTAQKIYRKLESYSSSDSPFQPFGHVPITEWLWMVNQLAKPQGDT